MTLRKRSVVNLVMAISGGLVVLSGFFLMFHYESHFAKAIHQIGGVLFVISGIMHIVINRRGLTKSFKAVLAVVLLFVVSVVIMTVTGVHTGHGGRKRAYSESSVTDVQMLYKGR